MTTDVATGLSRATARLAASPARRTSCKALGGWAAYVRLQPIAHQPADMRRTSVVGRRHADQLVFTMPGGGVMRLPNWRRSVFVSARRRAGLSDRFRVHDLRHSAASLMIQAGYPPKMLQEIMGHASITTTLDLYGHLYPGEMDRYADRLNEAAGMMSGMTDAAKMRPDGTGDEADPEGSTC
jgi:integrase